MLAEARLRSSGGLQRERARVVDIVEDVQLASAPRRGVKLEVAIDESLELDADVRLVTSALMNLVQNALKFTRDGGHVVVRTHSSPSDISIEVEDECGGLPPGKADELFRPFLQRGQDRSGIGLGLSIARDAIEAHEGALTVRDLPGKGCVFTIRLPR
jgi:signal transduction histidine kinase